MMVKRRIIINEDGDEKRINMSYLLIVLLMGLLSSFAMMFDSWIIYGWIHYFGGSAITYLLIKNTENREAESDE